MSVRLTGIDGSDPLGFLAALGVLRALDDRAQGDPPRLSWQYDGQWVPEIEGIESVEGIVDVVMSDLASWASEPALRLAYTKEGGEVDPDAKGAIQDLKPPPEVQRRRFEEAARAAAEGQGRSARTLACFGTDVALDNQGMIKPTALHFTAGQQQFLKMVHELREGLKAEHVQEALKGPWSFSKFLPSLSWTGTGQRIYALRATNPSGDKRGSCPGAEWLAFLGLSFFPCIPAPSPRGVRVMTTGVRGEWKTGVLTWPLWNVPATAPVVESLLRMPGLGRLDEHPSPAELQARGIATVLQASILRSDQGGYGSFTPPTVV